MIKQCELFNAEVARDYDSIMSYFDYSLSADICNRIMHITDIDNNSTLLEIGIGTGRFASELGKLGYYVIGIDNSKSMLDICKKKFPDIETYNVDIVDYQSNKKYPGIVCHAGPLRLNHVDGLNLSDEEKKKFKLDFGNLFFETYLSNKAIVEKAISNISSSMKPNAILALYIQYYPGRMKQTRSTLDNFQFDNKAYKKVTKYFEKKLYKTRKVYQEDSLIWSMPHILMPMEMDEFKKVCCANQLEEVCIDPSNHFYLMRKKK